MWAYLINKSWSPAIKIEHAFSLQVVRAPTACLAINLLRWCLREIAPAASTAAINSRRLGRMNGRRVRSNNGMPPAREDEHVKILDFGLAKLVESEDFR